ncbi:acyl-CoA thioesterase domain-containing protein [Nonomuraea wenchangensis]|uniref:acyl-CoA thioesterase n=1 Tax=Nonomuraea wenchangensis TaxID=568860 RepID=UPI00341CFCFC
MMSLGERLRPVAVGEDVFRGTAAPKPARIYGGEIAAQALSSANMTVGPDRTAHVIQCTYLKGGDPAEPVDYRVIRVRDGRSFSTRRVEAMQRGVVIQEAMIGYHVEEPGLTHQLPMPQVPAPDGLPDIGALDGSPGQAWADWASGVEEFEMRVVPADLDDPFGKRRFWCRFADRPERPAFGPVLTTYASDFTMVASVRLPHESTRSKEWLTTTLTHTVYFHRAHDSSDWVLWEHFSPVAAGARGIAIAHAYSKEGALVATAMQEGLVRSWPNGV